MNLPFWLIFDVYPHASSTPHPHGSSTWDINVEELNNELKITQKRINIEHYS